MPFLTWSYVVGSAFGSYGPHPRGWGFPQQKTGPCTSASHPLAAQDLRTWPGHRAATAWTSVVRRTRSQTFAARQVPLSADLGDIP